MTDRVRTLKTIRLPAGPLLAILEGRARRDGAETLGHWVRAHPRGGLTARRMLHRIDDAGGTISAQVADRWAIHLAGLTLDEIYGPDWDDEGAAVA